MWVYGATSRRDREKNIVLGFNILKLSFAFALPSKSAPSRLTLSALFHIWFTTYLPSAVPWRKLAHQVCGVKLDGMKVPMILVNPSSAEFFIRTSTLRTQKSGQTTSGASDYPRYRLPYFRACICHICGRFSSSKNGGVFVTWREPGGLSEIPLM